MAERITEWRPVRWWPDYDVNRHYEVRKRNTSTLVETYHSVVNDHPRLCVLLHHKGIERRVLVTALVHKTFNKGN